MGLLNVSRLGRRLAELGSRTVPLVSALVLLGCVEDIQGDPSRLDAPRTVGVQSEPAEAAPGATIVLTSIGGDAQGLLSGDTQRWALCSARPRLDELAPISPRCFQLTEDAVVELGAGPDVSLTIPADACRVFGPDPPLASDANAGGRPIDPDLTGGYYLPVVVEVEAGGELTARRIRLICGLAGANQQQSAEFKSRYQPNRNPALAMRARREGASDFLALDATEPLLVVPGEAIDLRVVWPSCPQEPSCGDGLCTLDETPAVCAQDCTGVLGCAGAETYLRFDPIARALVVQREAISVSWYATDGSFSAHRTGRAPDDDRTWSTNPWTAPKSPGVITIIAVARDERGGAAWATATVEVQ